MKRFAASTAVMSDAIPAPSSAAARGRRSLPVDVAVPSSAVAPARLTASTSCGAQVSASGAPRPAPSKASTRAAYFAASAAAALTPAPITTATTSPPTCLASSAPAVSAGSDAERIPFSSDSQKTTTAAIRITFASLWSLATSSSTEATLAPALRTGGASYEVTLIAALASTPSSASVTSLISFFFAAMIPFSEA